MNYSVWKYELDTGVRGSERDDVVHIPVPANILTASFQGLPLGRGELPPLVVWARVNPDAADSCAVHFRMVETGGPAPDGSWSYLATTAYDGYVLHVFFAHILPA